MGKKNIISISSVLIVALSLSFILISNPTKNKLSGKKLYVQPLGRVLSSRSVKEVQYALKTFYGLNVVMLPRKQLPTFTYYAARKRYRAEKLLDYLARIAPRDTFCIMGLTAVDISTTKGKYYDWGIMGLATLSGTTCIISRFRCRLGSRSITHARHRLSKVAVHEVGHTLGLEHCPTYGCLLEDARGTNKTIDREYVLCRLCRAKLATRGYTLPPHPKPLWPKPSSTKTD